MGLCGSGILGVQGCGAPEPGALFISMFVLLAPTGALLVTMVYYISAAAATSSYFHSIDSIDVTSVNLSRLNSINAIDVTRY